MDIKTAKNVAQILKNALPYIQLHSEKLMVIKFGGNAMINSSLANDFAQDIVLLKQVGIHPIVVHGGGPQINEVLEKYRITPKYINGLRYTDKQTMKIVQMVLCGGNNKDISMQINQHGGNAVGVSGIDANLFLAKKIKKNGEDLGFVGEITQVNPDLIKLLAQGNHIPVVAPIGHDKKGNIYNINADYAASQLAQSLKAEKLIYMTNVDGILDNQKQLLTELDITETKKLIENQTITEGMIPKIDSAITAVQKGIATHIINGTIKHAIILELLTTDGIGTLIQPQ